MKKVITVLTIILLIAFTPSQNQKLRVEADLPTWQAVLRVIDMSEAPAKDRVAIKDFIINQLNDTTINKPVKALKK